jgi:tellurite resistance protein TehA-like permease
VAAAVRDLNPGAFAFVMATGIVSTALTASGPHAASTALLYVGGAGYLLLWAAYVWRLVSWRQRFLSDLAGPNGFAFLTVVAASDVLGSRLSADHHYETAGVLLTIGVAGWLALGYGVPMLRITHARAVPLGQVNGTWFLWVVGTESVAVAAASLATHAYGRALGGLASVCWAVGLLQYLLTAALALARLLLARITPHELIPPYWIFMGAGAITVLAGAKILRLPPGASLLPHGFTLGLSLLLWSFCTWLIPLLLGLGVWRHLLHRVPLRYETGLWAMVFPLGMYAVATRELGHASGRHWLVTASGAEAGAAAVVWLAVFLGMLIALARAAALLRAAPAGGSGRDEPPRPHTGHA